LLHRIEPLLTRDALERRDAAIGESDARARDERQRHLRTRQDQTPTTKEARDERLVGRGLSAALKTIGDLHHVVEV
jgi:hypothetical protein